MSQNPQNPPPVQGQRQKAPAAHPERARTAPRAPRAVGTVLRQASMHSVPPPPYPPQQNALRTANGGQENSNGRPGVPPPPPFPPPHQPVGYYYGVMPQTASPFEYQPGLPPMARMYGYSYGHPPPSGLPVIGNSQPLYPGYPQVLPYPTGQFLPCPPEGTGSRARPPKAFSSASEPRLHGHDHTPRRSPRVQRAGARREASRPQSSELASEPHATAEATNAIGLPLRPGKPDCKHFLSRGWCSYGQACRYNHPDVVRAHVAPEPPSRPAGLAHGQAALGMAPSPWAGIPHPGPQYPVFGWPPPQMATGADHPMYGPGWSCHTSPVIYYPSAAPPARKVDKRQSQPLNHSARSSDSAASSSSRMLDPVSDNVSEPKEA